MKNWKFAKKMGLKCYFRNERLKPEDRMYIKIGAPEIEALYEAFPNGRVEVADNGVNTLVLKHGDDLPSNRQVFDLMDKHIRVRGEANAARGTPALLRN